MKKLLSCFVSIFKSVIDSRTKENQAGGENKDQEKGRKDFLEMLLELTQQRDNKSSLAINQVKALLLVTVKETISIFFHLVLGGGFVLEFLSQIECFFMHWLHCCILLNGNWQREQNLISLRSLELF
ncbi:hypothetical protein ACOSQ2_027499 [Xanthoceras sorbifolium]